MNDNKHWLEQKIIDFMGVIVECLDSTTYANDRTVYQQDISVVARWLTELHKGRSPLEISNEILSPNSDKHFADYWRQGGWGDREVKAFKELQDAVKGKAGKFSDISSGV